MTRDRLTKTCLALLPLGAGLAVALLLGACAVPPAPAAPPKASPPAAPVAPTSPAVPAAAADGSLFTQWRIVQARTEPMLDTRRARLEFRRDGQLVGNTSCNTMSAPYTLNGDKLKVGPVSTTRMACARLQMEQEDRVLTALEAAATARVRSDGLLELRDDEGRGVLRAVHADLPE